MEIENKKNKVLKRNFIISFLGLSLIPLMLVSLISFSSFKNSLHTTISIKLYEIAKNKATALQKWLFERHKDAEVLANSSIVIKSMVTITNPKKDIFSGEKAVLEAKEFLELVKNKYGSYDEINILDRNEKLVITTEKKEQIVIDRKHLNEALKGITFNTGVYLSPRIDKPIMIVATPIKNFEGEVIGVLAERIKLDAINKLMRDIEIGQTGESYIINREGYFLTESKFAPGYTLTKKISTEGTREAFKGKSGVGEYLDYRDKKVLGAYFYIPEMEWALMVEQDSSEAFQKISHLKKIILLISVITVCIIVAFTLFVSETIIRTLSKYDKEFKDQQKKIMRAEKLSALGQLAAGVAHEINNPLGGISNCLKLISSKINKSSPAPEDLSHSRKYLQTSEQELNRCREIVQNFLALSRRPTLKATVTDINTVIKQLFSLVEPQATIQNVKISQDLALDMPQVEIDAQQIHQALMNIIINSLEAMPRGGEIKVRSRHEKRDKMIRIDIADSGIGIPKENLPRLFEPFFSSKPEGKGTGLGLSIVYEIIDEHNGSLEVESELHKGTTVTITLPIVKRT